MGELNNAMCNYLSKPEVFADYWNGAVFGGVEEIRSDDLEPYDGNYYSITPAGSAKSKSRSRDVVKKVKQGTTYTILGVENQQDISYVMPVRQMEYDVMEYCRQIKGIIARNRKEAKRAKELGNPSIWKNSGEFLSGFRKEDKLIPTITTTFYHGLDEYDGCRDLYGMLKLEKEHEKYLEWIPNYPLNLITLKDIQEDKLETSLREVIGVMKRSQSKEELLQYYQDNKERFHRLDDETIDTIGVLIHKKDLIKYRDENGGVNLCKAFEDAKAEGKEEGKAEGMALGKAEGKAEGMAEGKALGKTEGIELVLSIVKLFKQGVAELEIAKRYNTTVDVVQHVLKELS